ncbi:MAG: lipase maturation factor family protein [Gammaproteobacteria bacterium]
MRHQSDRSPRGSLPGLKRDPPPARYDVVAWLFLRVLALIYIAAFSSMAVQIEGLVGSHGILPITDRLGLIYDTVGVRAYWLFPTLFWFNASDPFLSGVCVAGVLAGLAVFFNLFTRAALVLCYVLYLSILYAGQDFTSFQWDIFLLEAGFLAIFLGSGSRVIIFLYRWLLFRFMFLGGLVKIASGDPTWRDLSALAYHYETQPLPSPVAWYAHQLPLWFHQVSVAGVLLIELVIPFFIFMPRRLRFLAAWSFLLLQGSIILTGNYNFFNLLTIALCLFLFDDAALSGLVGKRNAEEIAAGAPEPGRAATISAFVLAAIVLVGNATLAWASNRGEPPPQPFAAVLELTSTLEIANSYGPFAVMTTRRGEIEIEASMNGRDWLPYEFKYKPGRLDQLATWLIPHQPRLDWQMWFAALRPDRPPYWFNQFMERLEEASPPVTSLLQSVPFPEQKPRILRARFYRYRYTDSAQRDATGEIWQREYLGRYWPPER